jgi:magnesium-transporting ATPase (P-type)
MPEPDPSNLPPPEELQFRRAQHTSDSDLKTCIACKQPIAGDYYQANGNTLCLQCAQRINSRQQAPPHTSLPHAALFGAIAAFAGSLIYAAVSLFGVQIGIIAILIGYMVGKAIRYASNGLGGRPQQVLAVVLTYFAITSSFIEVSVYSAWKARRATHTTQSPISDSPRPAELRMPTGQTILLLLGIAAAAPFLELFEGSNVASALISLFIIFIGLRQAWVLTARRGIVITGPY